MKKEDLKKFVINSDLKSLAFLLLRISYSLKNEKLSDSVIKVTERYNRLINAKNSETISFSDLELGLNKVSNSYIEIINSLPNKDYKEKLPETDEEMDEVLGKNYYFKSKSKTKKIIILLILIIILSISVSLFFAWESYSSPISAFEENFTETFINRMTPLSDGVSYGEYEGIWEIDLDSIGFNEARGISYNIIDSIGSYQNRRMVFYPQKTIMKIWSVSEREALTDSLNELRGIEFVRANILFFDRGEKVGKLSEAEIEKRSIAELGIVFFSHFEISKLSKSRIFFSIAHQVDYSKITERNDRLRYAINRSINELSSYKLRRCSNVSSPTIKNGKETFNFSNCGFEKYQYKRIIKKRIR